MPELTGIMFYQYHSHSLISLAESFSKTLETDSPNPLQSPWVVIQNNEIKEWLSLQYASYTGIAANLRYIFPSEFLWSLYRLHQQELPATLPGDLNAMHWALFQLFSEKPETVKLIPSITHGIEEPKRLFQFCGQLADVFDQYQVYRPERMELWLKDKFSTTQKDEKWQAQIWRLLNEKWNSSEITQNIPRRSEAFTELLQLIVSGNNNLLNKLPQNIYVFGLSQNSKPFLEIITSLSAHLDVHIFSRVDNKARYPGELNKLVENWSKPQSEQYSLLQNIINKKGIGYKSLNTNGVEDYNFPLIKIHSCHNKRREAEVLKNEMLRFLEKETDCSASDMLILVPDANIYASALEAVFENEYGEPSLPLSRLQTRSSQSAAYSLLMLLDLFATSFKASEVMQVMNLAPIRNKFDFTESDVDLIEEWVLQNNVFQGLGENFNSAYSWTKGINQLLSGFSIETGPIEVFKGLVPFNSISTSEHAERAAKFSNFIHTLKRATSEKDKPKQAVEWLEFINLLLNTFIGEDEGVSVQKSQLYKLIKKLNEQLLFANSKQLVSYEMIKPWLVSQIESESSDSGRYGQGVTVSTYVPYRAVPFQFIAMLGLNESVFPRKSVRPIFDLIYSKPEPGDRILKEDDTLLFLETINAAQSHLHLSYEGQDEKTDNIKLPSILIQQLAEAYFDDPDTAVKQHALHSFNEKYFTDEEWKSYSNTNAAFATRMASFEKKTKPFFDLELSEIAYEKQPTIEFSDLSSYFSNPCKLFVQNRLDVRNYNNVKELRDREIFKLESLYKYSLNDLLHNLLKEYPVQNIQEYVSTAAMIPEGMAGEKAFQNEKVMIDELLAVVAEQTTQKERKVEVSVQVDGRTLNGIIAGVCGKKLISYRVGNLKAKYLVDHWLKHLLLLKSDVEIEQSIFVYKYNDKIRTLSIQSNNITGDPLKEYLNWYLGEGNILEKLTFFPESAKAFAEKILKGKDESDAYKSAYNKWEDKWGFNPESEDYYNALIWRGREPLETAAFQKNAMRFWQPFFITQGIGGK